VEMLQNRPFFADLIRHKLAIILLARVLNLKCCTGTLSETKLIRGSVMKTKIVVVVFVCLFAASAVAISMLVPADAQAAEKINAKAGGDKVPLFTTRRNMSSRTGLLNLKSRVSLLRKRHATILWEGAYSGRMRIYR
jgi:hypothetical protein